MARAKTKTKPTHLALLRGINLGSTTKLPMADLAEIFAELGCEDVVTRGNTGNVLFRASATLLRRVPAQITGAIERRFGFAAPVILRSHEQLADAYAANPFIDEGADPAKLHVAFLASAPKPEQIAALDPNRSPPDRFAVRGAEVYLHCPNGLARTKLSNAWMDGKLATVSTVRTWRVVGELLELMVARG